MRYVYKCNECKKQFEIVADVVSAASLKPRCPDCNSKKVYKKIFPTPFVMVGDGHYKNDNILSKK